MTREEAKSCINTIELLRRLAFNVHGVMDMIDAGNCDKIIALLSGEACGDCVSRKGLLKIYEDRFLELQKIKHLKENKCAKDMQMGVNYCINILREMPPVNPQKTGHWISLNTGKPSRIKDGIPTESVRCSECDEWLTASDEYACKGNYCPNCGCRMVEPQESEEV